MKHLGTGDTFAVPIPAGSGGIGTAAVVTTSAGASSAGNIPALNASGAIDASMTPGLAMDSQRNEIINGNFIINQRGYVSASALGVNLYGHDRWKAGGNGCTYSFTQAATDTQVSISAGSLLQVVPGANIRQATYWLSWTGTATARVYQSGTPSYAAGTSMVINGVTVNTLAVSGLAAGTNTNVEFTSGTVGTVQLEATSALLNSPTQFERRHPGIELILCRRFFQQIGGAIYTKIALGVASSTTSVLGLISFPVPMYSAPQLAVVGSFYLIGTPVAASAIAIDSATVDHCSFTVSGSGYSGAYFLQCAANASFFQFSCEL